MIELQQGDFYGFCDRIEDSSLQEIAQDIWPDGSFDPRLQLAPVAERHFNSDATQWAWLCELKYGIGDYRWLYDRLSDQVSRDTLASIVQYRFSWDPTVLTQTQPGPKYFEWPQLVSRPQRAVYVDAGAYDGGSVFNFVRAYGDEYGSIHAFEPFDGSYAQLVENCGSLRDVDLVKKGLWNVSEKLRIIGKGQSATLVAEAECQDPGEGTIEAVALDDYLKEVPSFIKMDIEGSELRALQGARRLISAGLPAMAICAYHLISDLRTLPRAITGIHDNYELSLRNYKTRGSAEIVMYARQQGA